MQKASIYSLLDYALNREQITAIVFVNIFELIHLWKLLVSDQYILHESS